MSTTMIGLDTAKAIFHAHGVDDDGKARLRRALRRREVIPFFEAPPACTVVLEACGASHHGGRVLTGLGHTVRLVPAGAVRPFVKPGRKNDAADAAALREAARRPEVKFVPLGVSKLAELVAQVEAEESASEAARQARCGRALHSQLRIVRDAAAGLEEAIVAHARRDETARRLATIPGVGPVTASLVAATVADVGAFKRARDFAAWLGLVPRQHSTGGKPRLGRITKAGSPEIRTLLVLGATSMVRRAGQWNSAAGAWVRGVLARRPARLATVALANKMARIAWALMARKEDYRPSGRRGGIAVVAAGGAA